METCSALGSFDSCACAARPPPAHDAGDAGDAGDGDAGDATTITGNAAARGCTGSTNVLVLDGEIDGDMHDFVHPGYVRITDAKWSSSTTSAKLDTILINLEPTNFSTDGLFWTVELATDKTGQPLAVMTYMDAQRAAFAEAGRPGIDVSGDGRGCDSDFGTFTIEELQFTGTLLTHVLATFDQHCESMTAPLLHGCVKFDQAAPDAGDAGP